MGFRGLCFVIVGAVALSVASAILYTLGRLIDYYLVGHRVVPKRSWSLVAPLVYGSLMFLIPMVPWIGAECFTPPHGLLATMLPQFREEQARWFHLPIISESEEQEQTRQQANNEVAVAMAKQTEEAAKKEKSDRRKLEGPLLEEQPRREGQREAEERRAEQDRKEAQVLEKRTAEDYKKEREAREKQARQLTKEMFSGIPGRPVFIFATELGIGNPPVEYVGETVAFIPAMQKAIRDGQCGDLLLALDISGDETSPDSIRQALERLEKFVYPVMVRTHVDLSKAQIFYWTEYRLCEDFGLEKHPDGGAWIIQWHPLMREGIVVPWRAGLNHASYEYNGWVSNELAKARRKAELENKPFFEKPLKKILVEEAWKKLKAGCLGAKPSE